MGGFEGVELCATEPGTEASPEAVIATGKKKDNMSLKKPT